MVDTDNDESPSKLDILVSLISKNGTTSSRGGVVPITCRMPLHQMCWLQAVAAHTGMSVNKVIVEILEVGIEAALRAVPKTDLRAIRKLEDPILQALIQRAEDSGVA